jgi:hypothetical protein
MSTVIPIILEAERESVKEFLGLVREEELRAAMQAAAQASVAQKTALHQEPGRQEPMQRGSGRQDSDLASLVVADSGRVVRVGGGSRRPDPRVADPDPHVADPDPHVAGSTQVGGDLITNNTPGRPDVTAIGRSRPTKPVQSGKSKIVPEPDQLQSEPPVRPTLPHRT